MTDKEKHIAQKRKEIERLAKQQIKLIIKAAAMVSKPSKYYKVNLRRLGKMLAITMQVRALEMKKQMIIAQPIPRPIPNYVPGGIVPSGPAIVGEDGPELIISPKGIINVLPINKHFNKDQLPPRPIRPVHGINSVPNLSKYSNRCRFRSSFSIGVHSKRN